MFAADFRDRIVHHLYYNYTRQIYERTFILDSYSCIPGRGTHFGIGRLYRHIRQASQNYTVPCYVLKMDIRGYFMHIDRHRLLEICLSILQGMERRRVSRHSPQRWDERLDFDFLRYLTHCIAMLDPTHNCRIVGQMSDWYGLPHDKSLFHSPSGCGLPIGNLTSQLFSNVYLNVLDQYMKRDLHCRHYGRYVDDFYVVGTDRQWLLSLVPQVRQMLDNSLHLALHEGKTRISSIWSGVEFLGMWLKPHRVYLSRNTVGRIDCKLQEAHDRTPGNMEAFLNSWCGLLSHGSNHNLSARMLSGCEALFQRGIFDLALRHYHCLSPPFRGNEW